MASHVDTTAVRGGERPSRAAAPLTTPVFETTTFVFENADDVEAFQAGRSGKFLYSRYANPTVEAVEAPLAALEGADAAILTSSGMAAASTALFGLLAPGDELVCSAAIYGGTLHLIDHVLGTWGVTVRYATLEALAEPEGLLTDRTRVLWFESPINPTLRCVDVEAVARACRGRGVVSIVDNTFASPINQRPLEFGIDLVMHSATKYLNGHSDVTAGALAGAQGLIERLRGTRRLLGGVLDPAAAYALGRGMKTLSVRMARHNQNALAVAGWLERHPRVSRVFYPGLASHPDHAIAARQMRGFSGMVTVELDGGERAARRFFDRLRLVQRAASLGGVESLCSLPILTSHYGLGDDRLADAGVTRGMARLSIGLEHVDDLIADLDQALA